MTKQICSASSLHKEVLFLLNVKTNQNVPKFWKKYILRRPNAELHLWFFCAFQQLFFLGLSFMAFNRGPLRVFLVMDRIVARFHQLRFSGPPLAAMPAYKWSIFHRTQRVRMSRCKLIWWRQRKAQMPTNALWLKICQKSLIYHKDSHYGRLRCPTRDLTYGLTKLG